MKACWLSGRKRGRELLLCEESCGLRGANGLLMGRQHSTDERIQIALYPPAVFMGLFHVGAFARAVPLLDHLPSAIIAMSSKIIWCCSNTAQRPRKPVERSEPMSSVKPPAWRITCTSRCNLATLVVPRGLGRLNASTTGSVCGLAYTRVCESRLVRRWWTCIWSRPETRFSQNKLSSRACHIRPDAGDLTGVLHVRSIEYAAYSSGCLSLPGSRSRIVDGGRECLVLYVSSKAVEHDSR